MNDDLLPEWVRLHAPPEFRPIVHNTLVALVRAWHAVDGDDELQNDLVTAATELLALVDPNGATRPADAERAADAPPPRYLVASFLRLLEASPDAAATRWHTMPEADRTVIVNAMAAIEGPPENLDDQEGNGNG